MYPLGGLSLVLFTLIFWIFWKTSRRECFGGKRKAEGLLQRIRRQPEPEETLFREESRILQWIQYTNVVAAVAPMVGLLGTVSGMIGAFSTIAGGGMGKPELLAGDIGEALITTATGLVVGIPAMLAYFILKHRLKTRMDELEDKLKTNRAFHTETQRHGES